MRSQFYLQAFQRSQEIRKKRNLTFSINYKIKTSSTASGVPNTRMNQQFTETDSDFLKLTVTKGGRVGVGDGLGLWDGHKHTEVHGMTGQWGPAV